MALSFTWHPKHQHLQTGPLNIEEQVRQRKHELKPEFPNFWRQGYQVIRWDALPRLLLSLADFENNKKRFLKEREAAYCPFCKAFEVETSFHVLIGQKKEFHLQLCHQDGTGLAVRVLLPSLSFSWTPLRGLRRAKCFCGGESQLRLFACYSMLIHVNWFLYVNVWFSALLGVVGGTAEALHEGVALTRDLYKAGSGQTGIIAAIKDVQSL